MSQHSSHRILYIENNPGLARLFQRRLAQHGHQVDIAGNREEGLLFLSQHRYDIIAIDQQIHKKDGLSVIHELTQQAHFPPTILVTTHGNESDAVEAMKLGASDYIIKDIKGHYLDLLPSVIERALKNEQIKQERRNALKKLERRNESLVELNRIGQLLTATREIDQIFSRFLQEVTDLIGAVGSSIWLWESKHARRLICHWVFSRGKHMPLTDVSLEPGQGIAGWVAQHNKAVKVAYAPDDDRFASTVDTLISFQTTSILAVPLRLRHQVIGVLEVVNKKDGIFTESDLAMAETLAISGAIAIDNAGQIKTLHQQTSELQTRNDDLDAFAHTVAHDLKSPVSTLLGYTDMLRYSFDNDPATEREVILDSLSHLGRKMTSIIEEILLLAELRQKEVPIAPIYTQQLIGEVKKRLAFMIQEYHVKMVEPTQWITALGYAPWVEEIWTNYISNAIKYGGSPPIIELGFTEMSGNMVRFWVKDNGSGIPLEEQTQLFKPFTSLHDVRIKGHGLGLSITQRIVDKLGGTVGVSSTPGKGSVFSFTLPKA